MVNFSKELYLVKAACASCFPVSRESIMGYQAENGTSTVANSAKPYRQLSLVLRSLTSRTRRIEPSRAPRLESPVVEAILAPFFWLEDAPWEVVLGGLYSFATPFANSSSVTEVSRPLNKRNCDGWFSGAVSLSPVLGTGSGGASGTATAGNS